VIIINLALQIFVAGIILWFLWEMMGKSIFIDIICILRDAK